MRKIVSVLLSAFVILSNNVKAAEYDIKDNSVDGIDGGKYSTVIIIKASEDSSYRDIVYMGQTKGNSMFDSAVEFLLRDNPEEGKYIIKLGGKKNDETVDSMEFYIASPVFFGEKQYAKSFQEGESIAFGWEDITDIIQYKSILIQCNNKVFGISLDNMPEHVEGSVSLGLKIEDVPVQPDMFDAYLSTYTIKDGKLEVNSE